MKRKELRVNGMDNKTEKSNENDRTKRNAKIENRKRWNQIVEEGRGREARAGRKITRNKKRKKNEEG